MVLYVRKKDRRLCYDTSMCINRHRFFVVIDFVIIMLLCNIYDLWIMSHMFMLLELEICVIYSYMNLKLFC